MLTGVIYGAIVVVWAAYLVPLALRRHDEASRGRSIARFSSAMRVLARRGATGTTAVPASARVVLGPKRRGPGLITPEPAPAPPQVRVTPRANRAAERAAAARRRQVLSVLVGFTTVVVLGSLAGLIPWWSFVLPLLLIVVFLTIARRSVRVANEAYWVAAAAAPEQSSAVVVRRSVARVDASRQADDDEPTVTLTAADRRHAAATIAEEHVVAVSLETSEGGSLWDPLPVTLPTYVSAAVAKRTFRTIDLGEPGTWSSGHSETDSETVAAVVAEGVAATRASEADAGSAPADDVPDEVARVVNG